MPVAKFAETFVAPGVPPPVVAAGVPPAVCGTAGTGVFTVPPSSATTSIPMFGLSANGSGPSSPKSSANPPTPFVGKTPRT